MRRVFIALCALALTPSFAAPGVLSSDEVELVNEWGDTLADAAAEAESYAQTCRKPDNTCRPTAAAPRRLLSASKPCSNATPVMAWRRALDLRDADRYAAELQRYAATRALFDCSGPTCSAVVSTTTRREKENGVLTLSVCSVDVVLGVPGPPSRCQEALKRHSRSGVLLRGEVGIATTACSMGLRDFDAVFVGRADNVAAVRNLVGEALRSTPFVLTVMEDGNALVGTRAHLVSQVLAGWREWITVRVEIQPRGVDAGTSIYTTILVSKQATTSREAWTPASEPQEAAYLLALRNEFQRRGGILGTGMLR